MTVPPQISPPTLSISEAWPLRPLDELPFDDSFVQQLPADPEPENFRRQVTGAAYSRVLPTPVAAPQLLAHSAQVCQLIGLDFQAQSPADFAAVFSGNRVLPGMQPYAMCYGGHQFGNWAGQLGDGRAINLGEVVVPRPASASSGSPGQSPQRWTLQLKGAGPTPYSRTADGLAVLRSSVREFLCSEAMHHLGVPTTRALSLVATGERVRRDMFYDGNPRQEPGAVVCRVAESFLRFGNFELPASRGDVELLRRLADFTITAHYSHLLPANGQLDAEVYAAWFGEVCLRTLDMAIHWMRVGFVHGVMNTDNLSILGQTIDYGPYGWLEGFDPGWTPNTTDAAGKRYRYGAQPQIALWNLWKLAEALVPLVDGNVQLLEASLQRYSQQFEPAWIGMMQQKLGLSPDAAIDDGPLITQLLDWFDGVETDMTLFFRGLADVPLVSLPAADSGDRDPASRIPQPLMESFYVPAQLDGEAGSGLLQWLERYRNRLSQSAGTDAQRRARMNAVNPLYVLRNYLAQLAIDRAEQGDPAMISELLETLRHPYSEQPGKAQHAAKRPEWARHRAGCSMLSCSS